MNWAAQRERGSTWLIGAAAMLARFGGWHVGRFLTIPSTGWYLLTSKHARAASRAYLSRVLGRSAGLWDVARHFDHFACAVLDRLMLLSGHDRSYEIRMEGKQALHDCLARGRGCILLGAHLGSFEVLRVLARESPVPVWALMYRRNAGAMTGLLDRLAPSLRAHVLEIGDTASMIAARECVERGEIVGILADRAPPGHRMVKAPFLGGTAQFPSGPFVFAATLGAPVFLFYAVRTGKRRYEVRFAPFAERVALRRATRQEDLQAVVQRYAAALEEACRRHPFQWFNFFPFWEHDDAHPGALPGAHPGARPGPAQPAAAAPAPLAKPRPG